MTKLQAVTQRTSNSFSQAPTQHLKPLHCRTALVYTVLWLVQPCLQNQQIPTVE